MARLGISVYPEHSTPENDINYIRTAAKYGFKRIFTCLLSVQGKTTEEIIEEFKKMNDVAHESNMEVIMDVNPTVLKNLGVTYDNLSIFEKMHADGIRLDEGFNGLPESLMSYNKQNLKIELNSSFGNKYIDTVMSHYPNLDNIITCHNFYPQKYSGLSVEHFNKCNEQMKSYNLKTAAFVSSNNKNTFGPWPVNEGLCTLEMHRYLPISAQVRYLFATRMIDDVIIANQFPSDEEMQICSKITPGMLTFQIDFETELTPVEKDITYYKDIHVIRGDMSEYMIRSTMPRITFADAEIPPKNTRDLKRGDVVIVNDKYLKYKGELHIILKDMPNDGRKNVIGKVPENEQMLFDFIRPWKPFEFMK